MSFSIWKIFIRFPDNEKMKYHQPQSATEATYREYIFFNFTESRSPRIAKPNHASNIMTYKCVPSFLIAYRSYHHAINHVSSVSSGTFDVGKVLRNVTNTNERPLLQSYGNIYSRDYYIGLSNLVFRRGRGDVQSQGVLALQGGPPLRLRLRHRLRVHVVGLRRRGGLQGRLGREGL